MHLWVSSLLCAFVPVTLVDALTLADLSNLRRIRDVININLMDKKPYSELSFYSYETKQDENLDPDVRRNVSELIASKGYPVEEHKVQTEDGYILSLQRIPRSRNDNNTLEERPSILLMHGLLSASAQWVFDFPHQSPGYLLADAGYDVWMGNFRGNYYSKRHVKYNPKQSEFWKFSWDEMALYDLPALIDYVRKTTGQDKIFYAGHSMGTTTIFALLSHKQEFNDKLKAVIALAPVGNVTHITNPIRYFAPFASDLKLLLDLIGENEFLPTDELVGLLADIVCGPKSFKKICHNIVFLFLGVDVHLNESRVDVYLNHFPAGTSSRTIIQYAQNLRARKLQMYDYGKEGNMEKYGEDTPPIYDVKNIRTPVGLYSSKIDDMADPTDVADLEPQLQNLLEWYKIPCERWSHLDYAVGLDAYRCVYQKVIQTLDSLRLKTVD